MSEASTVGPALGFRWRKSPVMRRDGQQIDGPVNNCLKTARYGCEEGKGKGWWCARG